MIIEKDHLFLTDDESFGNITGIEIVSDSYALVHYAAAKDDFRSLEVQDPEAVRKLEKGLALYEQGKVTHEIHIRLFEA